MFLHPWAIALGLVAAGLPVVIHWLTRPRPVRLPLSTLRVVEVVVKQRRALWRPRDGPAVGLGPPGGRPCGPPGVEPTPTESAANWSSSAILRHPTGPRPISLRFRQSRRFTW